MRCFQHEIVAFACAIALPLVVECVAFVIPIHRPVVDPLAPMRDGFEYFLRHLVVRWDEVFELERDDGGGVRLNAPTFGFEIDAQCRQLEDMNIALLDGAFLQHFAGDFFEAHSASALPLLAGLEALLHFLRRNLLLVRSNPPRVAELVFHT